MLIGNRDRFAIELVPVSPSWERRYAAEAAAWAGTAIWAGGKNLARHVCAGEEEIREHFYVPLAPIADWIVRHHAALAFEERAPLYAVGRRLHDSLQKWGLAPAPVGLDEDAWLDSREAFWKRHFLAAGADGARVPNLAFLREDDGVCVVWAAPRFAAEPSVQMLNPVGSVVLPWDEVSRILLALARHVVDAFARSGVSALPFDWMAASPDSWGRADLGHAIELYCGRDLAQVSAIVGVPVDQITTLVSPQAADPASRAELQVVRDLAPRPSSSIGEEIRQAVDKAAIRDANRRTAWLDARAMAADAARAGTTAEEQGALAARAVREHVDLDGQPVQSVPAVLSRYGVDLEASSAHSSHERMIVVGQEDGTAAARVLHTARTDTRWGRRFEEARALGHALLDSMRHGVFGAASTRWAQEHRRRRSGAFAAELLLPQTALEAISQNALDGVLEGDRFEHALKEFGVGARTAAHQLFNGGWLSDGAVRDELIEEYGHGEG